MPAHEWGSGAIMGRRHYCGLIVEALAVYWQETSLICVHLWLNIGGTMRRRSRSLLNFHILAAWPLMLFSSRSALGPEATARSPLLAPTAGLGGRQTVRFTIDGPRYGRSSRGTFWLEPEQPCGGCQRRRSTLRRYYDGATLSALRLSHCDLLRKCPCGSCLIH